MAKKRTTVSVDEEVLERFQNDPSVNLSGLVNSLLAGYDEDEDPVRQVIEMRLEQERSNLEDLQSRTEHKEREVARLEERLEQYDERHTAEIEDYACRINFTEMNAAGLVLDTPEETVEEWADQVGVTVDELVAKAKEIYNA